MTALLKDRNTPEMALLTTIAALCYGVNGGSELFGGSLVCLNSEGLLVPGSASTALIPVGRLEEYVDNTDGADDAVKARVKPGVFRWDNSDGITIASRGLVCYVVDDCTVASTDGGGTRSKAGVVVDVDSSGVWVATGFSFFSSPAATPSGTLQKRTVTLDATITGSADTNGTANTPINVGAALPVGAIVQAVELVLTTPASGGAVSAADVDVGWAGATEALIKDFDALGSAAGVYDVGASAATFGLPKLASGKQVQVIVTPDVGHKLSALTAFSLTVNVYYAVAF